MHDPEQSSNDRRVREVQAAQVWTASRALVEQSRKRLAVSRALCKEIAYHAAPLVSGVELTDPDGGAGENP